MSTFPIFTVNDMNGFELGDVELAYCPDELVGDSTADDILADVALSRLGLEGWETVSFECHEHRQHKH